MQFKFLGINVNISSGDNVVIKNGKLISGSTNIQYNDDDKFIHIHGDVHGNIITDRSVQCDNIGGAVKAEGSVKAEGHIDGAVDAGGSVKCGNIKGDVRCGGSAKAASISGNVSAGGSIKC